MGIKTSVVPQLDFLLPCLVKKCHRPTKLTGEKNILAREALLSKRNYGLTADELARERDWLVSTAGSCLVELRWLGYARKTESTRKGKAIYLAITEEEQP